MANTNEQPATSSRCHRSRLISALILALALSFLVLMPLVPSSAPDRTETLFVYGTLMNPWVRSFACLCRTSTSEVTLTGYEKIGRNIVPSEGSTVSGYRIRLSPNELTRVDWYEGVPENYRRERIMIDGTEHWVYFKNE